MTDAEFNAWLVNPSAIRIVLVEVVATVAGVDTTRYLATRGYVTSSSDTPANTHYLPIVTTGVSFTEQLSLTGGASLSTGDLEIANYAGERDAWLDDIWDNRPIQAFIGDPRWARSDFRMIFNGIVATINSKNRDTLNLIMTDKLQRLNTPVIETKLGGTSANKDVVLPLSFGEVHNITPLLSDPVTLEYQIHNGPVESIFEVRDNGKPVSVTVTNSTGKFVLNQQSFGAITVSAQGDKPSAYNNTVSQLVQRLVTGYGKSADQFVTADLDTTNLAAFDTACPQPVGLYLDAGAGTNVLEACQTLASSVGAGVVMSRLGKMRLIQLQVPGAGTPTTIQPSQMIEKSLQIVDRPKVVASVMLGFNKNWTVQDGLVTSIPEEHKVLYATEWLTSTQTDSTVKSNYKLNADPEQIDTMLLRKTDADAEAIRRRDIWKVARTVYSFIGTADLLSTLELGNGITLFNQRFNMSAGKTGTIISLAPNWLTGRVTVKVLI